MKVHKHHTIPFDSVYLIDWHLRNLWSGGFETLIDMTAKQHIRHHKRKNKVKRYEEASRQLPKKQYARLFPV